MEIVYPEIRNRPYLAVDIETYDPELKKLGPGVRRPSGGAILGVAVGDETDEWYVPVLDENQQFIKESLYWLRQELGKPNPTQLTIGANYLYDLDWLWQYNCPVDPPYCDVLLGEALIDETSIGGLDGAAERRGVRPKQLSALFKGARKIGLSPKVNPVEHLIDFPVEIVAEYARGDVRATFDVWREQGFEINKLGLASLFDLECRLMPLLLSMRRRGVKVNMDKVHSLANNIESEIRICAKRLQYMTGSAKFNYNAPAQVGKVLEDLYGYNLPRTPTGKPSVTKEWLAEHEDDNEFIENIGKVRKYEKLLSTFVHGVAERYEIDGYVHPLFHATKSQEFGARSGRFSSSNPNMQFIPKPGEDPGNYSSEIRGLFVPEDGERWVSIDYSQIEFRFLAHYARGLRSDYVRKAYNDDRSADFHALCGEIIGQHSSKTLTRSQVKRINFGLVYGMGREKLARSLGLSLDEAVQLFQSYKKSLPFVFATADYFMQMAARDGEIRTVLNRRRLFDLWEPTSPRLRREIKPNKNKGWVWSQCEGDGYVQRAYTYRALNALLQGSAADLLKKAMVDLWESGIWPDESWLPTLTIHDELTFSLPKTRQANRYIKDVTKIMENTMKLEIPVQAEVSQGEHWGALK